MVIGLGYKKRVGKDEIAKYLIETKGCKKVWFAEALYDECKKLIIIAPKEIRENSPITFSFDSLPFLTLSFKNIPKKNEFLRWFSEVKIGINEFQDCYDGMKDKDRWLLQWWGTDVRRNMVDDKYWVNIFIKKVKKIQEESRMIDIVVTDMRFPNEREVIEDELDGVAVKISRPGLPTDGTENHESETALDNQEFKYNIKNNGTIEDLHKKVDELFEDIMIDNLGFI